MHVLAKNATLTDKNTTWRTKDNTQVLHHYHQGLATKLLQALIMNDRPETVLSHNVHELRVMARNQSHRKVAGPTAQGVMDQFCSPSLFVTPLNPPGVLSAPVPSLLGRPLGSAGPRVFRRTSAVSMHLIPGDPPGTPRRPPGDPEEPPVIAQTPPGRLRSRPESAQVPMRAAQDPPQAPQGAPTAF